MNIFSVEVTNRTSKLIALAKRTAEDSNYGKFRHGAVLVKRGKVVNTSYNKNNTCSFGKRFRCPEKGRATLHAELGVILNIGKERTEGSDIYVVRVNSDGIFRNSKPCSMCEEAMRFVGVKRVYYSIDGYQFKMIKL